MEGAIGAKACFDYRKWERDLERKYPRSRAMTPKEAWGRTEVAFVFLNRAHWPPCRNATSIQNVNSLTVAPSLHRFVSRRALETTAFGYEVIAGNDRVDDCLETVRWADCWCPDAAQFVLIDACKDLRAGNCQQLVRAVLDSHLHPKIRLVCAASTLDDDELLAILHRHDIGFLLANRGCDDFEELARKGILGVRVDARAISSPGEAGTCTDARGVVEAIHDIGLRSIASQIPTSSEVRNLLAMGFDYVSQRDGGFVPTDRSFSWRGKVV